MSDDTPIPDISKPIGTPPSNVPSITTPEEDRTTASQRRINLVWEATQATVALSVTFAKIYCSVNQVHSEELTNAFFLIIGFY